MHLIYPYRNREIQRVKNSLDSLARQVVNDFRVYFVNYGSAEKYTSEIKDLCREYDFVKYSYCATECQPWNKSRALNSVIKKLDAGFCFVADIDMIFHPRFVEKAIQLQETEKTVYFQVGFLEEQEKTEEKSFEDYKNYRKSNYEATGLSMFPVKVLQELRGFDEFYHFWGAEDTDMHVRLKNAGYEVDYYDNEILMLHQWHPSYRSNESNKLMEDFQINGIVQLNHQHLKFAKQHKVTKVNLNGWGETHSRKEIERLENVQISFEFTNEKRQIDDLLFGQLPKFRNEIVKIAIKRDFFYNSPKYKLKKLAGKKVPEFYSQKQQNDKILLHLISFYRDVPYIYQIQDCYITFAINIK